jgi:phage terminase large subunit GpA-like protein
LGNKHGDYQRSVARLKVVIAQTLAPPATLTGSEWAIKYGRLSPEGSAKSGSFTPYAYQFGMLDAMTDPDISEVVVMKAARVGYTRCLDFTVGYYIHQDPCPILIVLPRTEDAEGHSKDELVPMIRDIAELSALAGDAKAKKTGQTILSKNFLSGARVKLVGANSPAGLRRITVRVVLFDEVDGFPAGAGEEGDQIKLGTKRAETYWNSKIILGSTPTIKAISRIQKAFDETDQRRFFVPCPHCDEFQTLEWGGKDIPYGMKWKKGSRDENLPETAFYACKANACVIEAWEKADMVARGEWRATKPGMRKVGFHISALYSPLIKAAWPNLVREWLDSKDDPLLRQTFVNLVLGEAYEDRGDKALAESRLAARREVYPAEVPDGVAVITVGGDTQDDRVEIEVVGWGRNEESWSLAVEVIEGDPAEALLWQRVDAFLKRVWHRADGRGFEVAAACIDSGGHHTQMVYEFCKARLGRRIWAVKGESARAGMRSPVWPVAKPSKRKKQGFRPVILGVNAAKDSIRARLHLTTPGPGYMHFPADRDINYFAQLVSERLMVKDIGGRRFRVWELPPGRANEALDARVYAYAALCGLMHMGLKLNQRADQVAAGQIAQQQERAEREDAQFNMTRAPAAPVATVTVAIPAQAERGSVASKLA